MAKVKITAHTYVCELPETIQNQIFQECKETFESLAFPVDIQEQIENVKGCKMCDLEDTINVQKYYTKWNPCFKIKKERYITWAQDRQKRQWMKF